MATDWRVYGQDTVAARLTKSELPGFFRRQIVVGPHELAIVQRNGAVVEAISGARATVAGLWDRFASLFGGGADIDVIFVDFKPIDVTVFLGETVRTQDAYRTEERVEARASGAETSSANAICAGCNRPVQRGWRKCPHCGRALWAGGGSPGVAARAQSTSGESGGGMRLTTRDEAQVSVVAVTADHEVVSAECRLRLGIVPEEVKGIGALLGGRSALATWDVAGLLREELLAKVLVPRLATLPAADLRRDGGLQERLLAESRDKLGRALAPWGLRLENLTISWGLTDVDRAAIAGRQATLEDEAKKFAHQRRLAEMQRETEAEKLRLENLHLLKQADAKGDEGLKDLLLIGEIRRENLKSGQRLDVAKIDAEIRGVQIEVERKEAGLALETDRNRQGLRLDVEEREQRSRLRELEEKSRIGTDEMSRMVALQQKMKAEKHLREMEQRRLESDADFQRRGADIEARARDRKSRLDEDLARMGMMERLVTKGLETGAADSSVLRTMLEQSTQQSYATTDADKVKAIAAAEAAKHNLEAFKSAEDRERAHQQQMTGLSANLMAAAKQTPPGVMVTQPGMAVPVMPAMPAPPTAPPGPAGQATCASCGAALAPGWRFCPGCNASVSAAGPTCPKCRETVQAGWKACPSCGSPLAAATGAACKTCGADMKPAWKSCPACGNPR